MRRILLLLTVAMVVAAMMVVMAGTALAAPGKSGQGIEHGQGHGHGQGGGDLVNFDNGDQKAYGGGTLNNPNVSGF